MVNDRLLDAAEVAELLHVPVSWIRAETRAGRIPHIELGRYRRYDRETVLAWVAGQRRGQWRKHRPRGSVTLASVRSEDYAPPMHRCTDASCPLCTFPLPSGAGVQSRCPRVLAGERGD